MGKKKKDETFLRKEIEEKQISATVMTSVYGKGIVFLVNLKLKG